MKLLIRTITIATIGFFMILICLHATIVETARHEIEVANTAALNRTLDAWEKNRELINKGETNHLFFKTNEEFYWFFYDSLEVQLTGNVDVTVMANAVDVDKGILDVDTTIGYVGLDRIERTYTVHADTYGKIDNWIDDSPERQNLLTRISNMEIGAEVEWAGRRWYVFNPSDATGLSLIAVNNEPVSVTYTTESNYADYRYKYEYTELNRIAENFTQRELSEVRGKLAEKTMTDLRMTEYGMYNEDVSYTPAVATAWVPSLEEWTEYNTNTIRPVNSVWTRTLANTNEAYIINGSGEGSPLNALTEYCQVRLAITINKDYITSMELDRPEGAPVEDYLYTIE